MTSNQGITRREILAAGLGTSALLSLGPLARAETPKQGGRLRLGVAGASTSDSLDPATWSSIFMQAGLMAGVYNNLSEVDVDGNIVPELAESWEASPDAKIWTFKLRQGVEFHNGKTLSAEDVIASINHHRDENSKSAAKSIVESIVDIRADGPTTVVFELASGNADFPFIVNDYHLVIMPSKDGKADWQSVIGTGGYTLESLEHGVRMLLKRQPNYWKANRAHFDEAELISIADVTARMNALVTGEVDAINRVDLKTLHLLQRKPNVVIEEVTSNQHFSMPMFVDHAPFDDLNVRLALKLAIDREALLQTILRGHGALANDHPIGPSNRFYAKELEQRQYDPEKARWHLQQAGLDKLTVDLHAADAAFNGAVDSAVLFKEHAAKAGIEINVVREPNDGYWSNVWLQKPFCMSYWGGRPTEDWMFSLTYSADAKWNDTHWQNARFNELLIQARAELDEAKRRAMYVEMQQLVRDDGGTIIPLYANYIDARSTKLAHPDKIASNWDLDGWKIVERWWFA